MSERLRGDLWTVPNALSAFRLVGVFPLLWLGWRNDRQLFLAWLVVLLFTDWIDGKLAVALDQRTEIGARLDSVSDWLMYTATALGFWWLVPHVIVAWSVLILAVVGSWVLSVAVSLGRFGKLPSYHTRGAKLGWLVTGVAAVHVLWTGDEVAVPWALAMVALGNLEAVVIGLVLPRWEVDVPSAVHALRLRREARRG